LLMEIQKHQDEVDSIYAEFAEVEAIGIDISDEVELQDEMIEE